MNRDDARELLETRWERLGYDALLQEEQDFLLFWWLEAEVSNGGFHQYFYNSTADYYPQTLDALKRIGALRTREILSRAVAAFGEEGCPTERELRIERLEAIEDAMTLFDSLYDELFEPSREPVADDEVPTIYVALGRVRDAYSASGIRPEDYEERSPVYRVARVLSFLVLLLVLLLTCAIVFAASAG